MESPCINTGYCTPTQKVQKFTIEGRLPNLNDLISAAKSHRMKFEALKQESMELVKWSTLQYKIKPVGKAQIIISCFEKNAKRDEDNVLSGAMKIILDALQNAKIIEGDGRKYIELVLKPVKIDRENPRIEVEIREL